MLKIDNALRKKSNCWSFKKRLHSIETFQFLSLNRSIKVSSNLEVAYLLNHCERITTSNWILSQSSAVSKAIRIFTESWKNILFQKIVLNGISTHLSIRYEKLIGGLTKHWNQILLIFVEWWRHSVEMSLSCLNFSQ